MARATIRVATVTLVLSGAVPLTGCMDRDPYRRTDVWRPTGANAANVAAQVANPGDLIRGQGTNRTDSKAQSIAIERILSDQPRSLSPPSAGFGGGRADTGGNGGAGGNTGGAGAGAGATGAGTAP